MMKITFHDDFPEAYEAEVEETLKTLGVFIEPFVEEIKVYFEQFGEGEASVHVLRHYHRANLSLNARFFSESEEERTSTLAHEIAHVLVDPIAREADHLIEHFIEDADIYNYVNVKVADALEKTVDSIALAFGRLDIPNAPSDLKETTTPQPHKETP